MPHRQWICVLAIAWLTGCSDPLPPRDIILITIDTLRADHLGCTGDADARTPVLDHLASTGTLYDTGVSPTPLTLPAHATLLSGRLPIEHGVRDNRPFVVPADLPTLATELHARGYQTCAVIGGEPLARGCGLERGFDIYDDELSGGQRGSVQLRERTADQVTDAAIAHVRQLDRNRSLLLFAHYFDAHDPYIPPPPFAETFRERPYAGEIAFVDQQIGRLLEGLRTRPRLQDALILITADHGESLGEHGEPTHGVFLYDATIRVPVIVRDRQPGGRRTAQVRLQDIHDFVLARADERDADLAAAAARGEPAFIESLYAAIHCDYRQLRGLRTPAGLKYLEAGDEELYDLIRDPKELADLAADPQQRNRLATPRQHLADLLRAFRTAPPVVADRNLPGYLSSPLREEQLRTRLREDNTLGPVPIRQQAAIGHLHEGVRLADLRLFDAAAAELRAGVTADPGNPSMWYWLGRALRGAAEQNHDAPLMQDAIAAFERTRVLRPDHADARDLLVFCLTQIGRYEDAATLAERARGDNEASSSTFEALGKLLLTRTGSLTRRPNPLYDEAGAAAALYRAIELAPQRADVRILEFLKRRYSLMGDSLHRQQVERWLAASDG